MSELLIQAGRAALARMRRDGLRPADIAVIPAAAGGPKGLILQKIDQWLFGEWLPQAPRERMLIGASIGAWRMAAACHADPVAALQRLGDLYCEQRYPHKPSAQFVTDTCRRMLADFIGGHEEEVVSHPRHRLHILASRGSRWLAAPKARGAAMAGFGAAILGNLLSRSGLARHMERVVIGDAHAPADWLRQRFDAFATHFARLAPDNLDSALLASGTLPFIMEPVRGIPHAPSGTYWDGGLIDYHLALPYSRISEVERGGLVLYPHFGPHIVPGWFDKQMPWRFAHRARDAHWLDNVILVSPTRRFLERLPNRKLPDRNDFVKYGLDHDARTADWQRAIAESARLRDELAAFVEKPDLSRVKPLTPA
ncbi:hypothetical protein SAMN06265795_101508 [Noviherbaspirillum humi]|uniref:Patatin-like phospholipase n=1 Tax=Noviherbaspirillum humi TaxID=1688639 RepID=A0A239CLD6_9BURK|nr:patatin-like phospholipase family protein [Noviherbaspirillum humi]SNS20491.1 hypothetical protein SAMN06265795_101508 [Noviherbaspirillum humi]